MSKTKKFRVARSGPTIDGREITPEQIDQMAASYDPQKYGARIWIEHSRSMMPDGAFRAMGDVLSLSAEADGDQRALYAEVNPTDDLIKLAKSRQKVFWSIEMQPNFAKTGKAYMSGLSITDSPASLGTEMMSFSAKSRNDMLFSAVLEGALEDVVPPEDKSKVPDIFARVKKLLQGRDKEHAEEFADQGKAIMALAEEVNGIRESQSGFARTADLTGATESITALRKEFSALVEKLSVTDASSQQRPTASGKITNTTDC